MAIQNLPVNVIKEMRKVVTDPRKRRALTPYLKQPQVKTEIGRRIADIIIDRTLEGKDKNERDFVPYSKEYRKSNEFKVWKGGKRKPDLKLTGSMLAHIDVVKLTPTGCEIGFVSREEKLKAQGHVEGANYLPGRDFWGLPNPEEMEKLFDEVVSEAVDTGELIEAQLLEELAQELELLEESFLESLL
jgi:hypothetical protein